MLGSSRRRAAHQTPLVVRHRVGCGCGSRGRSREDPLPNELRAAVLATTSPRPAKSTDSLLNVFEGPARVGFWMFVEVGKSPDSVLV